MLQALPPSLSLSLSLSLFLPLTLTSSNLQILHEAESMSNPSVIKRHPWVQPERKQAHPEAFLAWSLSSSDWALAFSHRLCLTLTRNQLLLHLFYPQPLIPFYSHSNYTITLPFLFSH